MTRSSSRPNSGFTRPQGSRRAVRVVLRRPNRRTEDVDPSRYSIGGDDEGGCSQVYGRARRQEDVWRTRRQPSAMKRQSERQPRWHVHASPEARGEVGGASGRERRKASRSNGGLGGGGVEWCWSSQEALAVWGGSPDACQGGRQEATSMVQVRRQCVLPGRTECTPLPLG